MVFATGSHTLDRPVLVIGAGVAGSCCALRLRRHGIDVHLAEKTPFPRAKVCGCCIGGAGLQLLDQLSLRSWVQTHGADTVRWSGSIGDQRIELDLPEGVAISRERLDSKLLSSAGEAGAKVFTPAFARVDQLNSQFVAASLEMEGIQRYQHEYSVVVIASGLNAAGSQRLLPWREKPNGPFGVAFFAKSDSLPVRNSRCKSPSNAHRSIQIAGHNSPPLPLFPN